MDKIIKKEILELKSVLDKIGGKELKKFSLLCEEGKKTIKNNKIMFCGNGGSASDSQHLATELVVKYKKKKISYSSYGTYNRYICFNSYWK